MADLYDKFGRKIIVGDVLKVYHFTAALRRKRHYMYKQVVDRRRLPKGLEVLVINHLDLNDSHYLEVCDGRKLRLGLIPVSFSRWVAKVLMFGAEKYGPDNWRKGGPWVEVYECQQRHMQSWLDGEDLDPESGLPHLAHAACNLAFLIEFAEKGIGTDDRYRQYLVLAERIHARTIVTPGAFN